MHVGPFILDQQLTDRTEGFVARPPAAPTRSEAQAMTRTVETEQALLQAALTITSELSLDAVLKKIVDAAKDLVQARYAALGVAREDRKSLVSFIVSGVSNGEIAAVGHWPRGLGLLGALLQEPRPLRLRNIVDDPRSIGFPAGHPEMTSFLGVPISSRGRILGNFYLTDKIGAEEFTSEDEDLIVGLAAFAAVAIENARLYTEADVQLRRKIEEVERSTRQLEFLVDLPTLLLSGPEVSELPLEPALTRATLLLGDACGVYLLDQGGALSRNVLVHQDPSRARAAAEVVDASWDTVLYQVVNRARPIFMADVEAAPTSSSTFSAQEMRERKFSAAMATPVKSAKQAYGVFLSLASQPQKFTPEDFSFGMLMAQRLATFIENYLLVRDLNDALKTRDEFLSIATHELKTPATVLVVYADLALKSLQSSPKQLNLAVNMIKTQALRLASLADELLDVAKIKAGRLELQKARVELPAFVADVARRFEAQLTPEDQARLKLCLSADALAGDWDSLRLEQVLINLLSNAFKYSPMGGDIDLTVESAGEEARVSVKDRGLGIPMDYKDKVFELFFRSPTAARAKTAGAGLGLHISKEIIEYHGGQMWFESVEGKGSTFYFTLPLGR